MWSEKCPPKPCRSDSEPNVPDEMNLNKQYSSKMQFLLLVICFAGFINGNQVRMITQDEIESGSPFNDS